MYIPVKDDKSRHKNCINKEKLLAKLNYHLSEHLKSCEAETTPYWYAMQNLIEIIENGDFDNE